MSINILSLYDLDNLFANFIQNVLGWEQDKVRISFSTKGQVSSKIEDEICYVHCENVDSDIQQFKNRLESYKDGKVLEKQIAMRELKVQVIFYGESSDKYSTILYETMFLDSTNEFLHKNNLSLKGDETRIMPRTHEKINERWWDRIDMEIHLYNSVSIEESVNDIQDVNVTTVFNGG